MNGEVKRKRFLMVLSMLFVGIPLLLSQAAAENLDYQEYTLGEIVNIGKGSAVRDIAIIDEITPEDFEAVNAESVADALTYVPGVQVTYGRKFFPSITIHGFDQNRVLTMIDGVPYYETKYGGLDLNQVSLEGVARIDVVKGAASVLYGPNALGGAVNIITKQPTAKPFFSVNAEYGLDGLEDAYKASFSHGRKIGTFNYWLSYSRRDWDSWDLSDDFDPVMGVVRRRPGGNQNLIIEDGGERLNSDYQTDNFWAKVGFEPTEDTEVYLNLHYIKTEKGAPPDIYSVRVFPDFSQFSRISAYDDWGADVSAEHAFTDRFTLQGKLYYHDHEDEYESYDDETFTNAIALSTYKDYILGAMVLGDVILSDVDTLRFSVHYKGDSHEQRDLSALPYAESFAYTGSIGLENELSWFGDRLSVVAGVSYDWFDVTEAESDPNNNGNIVDSGTPDRTDEFNPMIGATYQVNDAVKLFASVARKTRFPTLSQIYSGEDPVTGADTPNLDLEAETSVNYTMGFSWAVRDVLTLEVSPFLHDISDYITRDVPPAVNPFEQYKNYDDIEMRGVEVNAEITPVEDLLLKIGYMYDDASDESDGRVTDKVRDVPEYTLNLSAQYVLPKIKTKLNLTLLYMGESYSQLPTPTDPGLAAEKNDSYSLCNAKITQPFLDNRLEAFVSVQNLFDEDEEPSGGQPAPGRQVWLGLTYRN